MRSFALSLFAIVSGVLFATASRAITIQVVSPSAEVIYPLDNSIYNIYPRTSAMVTAEGQASAILKITYNRGDRGIVEIRTLSSIFLDGWDISRGDVAEYSETGNYSIGAEGFIISELDIGDHTAKFAYKVSTFNFQMDPNDPSLFHSIPPVPNPPPVTLLDINDVNNFEIVPGPLPILGLGAVFGYSRKLKKLIKASKSPEVKNAIG